MFRLEVGESFKTFFPMDYANYLNRLEFLIEIYGVIWAPMEVRSLNSFVDLGFGGCSSFISRGVVLFPEWIIMTHQARFRFALHFMYSFTPICSKCRANIKSFHSDLAHGIWFEDLSL